MADVGVPWVRRTVFPYSTKESAGFYGIPAVYSSVITFVTDSFLDGHSSKFGVTTLCLQVGWLARLDTYVASYTGHHAS